MLPVSLDCQFLIAPSVFSNIYLSCVLCTLCCQFLWIVHFWLPLRYSLTFICPVSCVPYVASFSGLSFFITPSVFSNIYLSCVLCILCCQFLWIVHFWLPLRYSLTFIRPVSCVPYVAISLDCPFLIAPSVFSNIYLSCVLCTLCCQFLWIVHFWLPLRYSLTIICPESCVPYVASFSGLSVFNCLFGIL
jgi:hypothetical protein